MQQLMIAGVCLYIYRHYPPDLPAKTTLNQSTPLSTLSTTQQVPWDFVVPEEAPWPFFCRGVELGKMCDLVRRHQEVSVA